MAQIVQAVAVNSRLRHKETGRIGEITEVRLGFVRPIYTVKFGDGEIDQVSGLRLRSEFDILLRHPLDGCDLGDNVVLLEVFRAQRSLQHAGPGAVA